MANPQRKPLAPGEILKAEFMDPWGLTQEDLAKRPGISRRRINEIIRGHREITPDTALRLSQAFRVSPERWLNLPQRYHLWMIAHDPKRRKQYLSIKPIRAKAAEHDGYGMQTLSLANPNSHGHERLRVCAGPTAQAAAIAGTGQGRQDRLTWTEQTGLIFAHHR